jgi:RNA polymerase sigma-70 factor, ECF subfamily
VLTLVASHLAVLAVLAVTFGPQLVERIARGDAAALRSAYDAHAGRVLALALRIMRSKAEAEDVVQDTFLEVWRRAGDYDASRGELSAWILSMARSRCIDRVRRARVRARYAQQVDPAPHDGSAAVDDSVAASEHGARIRQLLLSLPEEQRHALELAYFEGLTQQEIATRIGVPLGTIKTRLRLALEKLEKGLGGRT